MKTGALCSIAAPMLALVGLTLGSGSAVAQEIAFTKFDAPHAGKGPGQGTFAFQIIPDGSITGYYIDGNNSFHGFLRTPDGKITEFDAPDALDTAISGGMNSARGITGNYVKLKPSDEIPLSHGFLRSPQGKFTTFDVPGAGQSSSPCPQLFPLQGTWPGALNPRGEIAGWYLDNDNVSHGFLRAPDGAITKIDTPHAGTDPCQGTATTSNYSLNPAGALSGVLFDDHGVLHGFLRHPDGAISEFDAPDAGTGSEQGTYPFAINTRGAITGSYADANSVRHGFIRDPNGDIAEFDAPGAGTGPGQGTNDSSINPAGAVTGTYVDGNNVSHGFVRSPRGIFTTFKIPGAGTGAFQGTFSTGNNPAGTIQGYYIDKNSVAHGFVGIPPPAFAGTPGHATCLSQSVTATVSRYGGLLNGAAALGSPSVAALQDAIVAFCGG